MAPGTTPCGTASGAGAYRQPIGSVYREKTPDVSNSELELAARGTPQPGTPAASARATHCQNMPPYMLTARIAKMTHTIDVAANVTSIAGSARRIASDSLRSSPNRGSSIRMRSEHAAVRLRCSSCLKHSFRIETSSTSASR